MIYIQTDKAPSAVGPYSQAVEMNGVIYCSGQIPIVPETGDLLIGDVADATRQGLLNLTAVLAEAGLTLDNIVKTTVFLADMNSFAIMNGIYEEFFGDHRPARAAVEVAKLPKGVDVEIDCIAVRA